MEREEAGRILVEAIESRRAAQEVVRQERETINGTELVIRGLLRLFPELETGDELDWGDPEQAEAPRSGSEAVRAVLQEEPEQWMSVRAVLQRLEHNDWMPESENPLNAVRAALERAVAQGGIEKGKSNSGQVVYRFSRVEVGRPKPARVDVRDLRKLPKRRFPAGPKIDNIKT
jgi:hypothetical protein